MKVFALFLLLVGMASCFTSLPLQTRESENNATYNVSYLFEHDGCKVYRFYDMGNFVYFTTRGEVTSIKNDSTQERTISFPKDTFQLK